MKKPRKLTYRPFIFSHYIIDSLQLLKPPDELTVSEWAEAYRVLDSKSSAMPGLWKNRITPYLVGIMDEFNNYETDEIVFVKPTQVGGTEAMQNMLGFVVAQDPAPTMIVYPTDKLGDATSENRLQPMLRSSPALKEHFNETKSQRDELQLDNMYIAIAGANSPSGLASRPIKYLFLDEVDKYPPAGKKEADPISLAKERTKTFRGRKIYSCSTPTLRTGHIWQMKERCEVEKHYFVPCVHCGKFIEFQFQHLKWPSKDGGLSHADRAAQAFYVCQECGAVITDSDKTEMLQKGQWRAVKQTTQIPHSIAFWISTLYSPFTSWEDIAAEFMRSKDDPDKLHNFSNSWLAEPWEDTRLKTNADMVLDRQTVIPQFVVPNWAKLLTAGVDVQESSIYYTIRAFGDYITSQNITHGQVYNWQELDDVMNLEYKTEDGRPMIVSLACIDSGDQTDEVYNFCAEHEDWALPCKGTDEMLSHYKISKVNKTASRAYGMSLILIDGSKYKDLIAARMKRDNGEKSWMVYQGCDREYAEQVTSEHKIVERTGNGREKQVWRLKQSHGDNHYLDCEVYCMAAADLLGVRTLHLSNIRENAETRQEAPNKQTQPSTNFPEENWLNSGGDWLGGAGESWL